MYELMKRYKSEVSHDAFLELQYQFDGYTCSIRKLKTSVGSVGARHVLLCSVLVYL